MNINIGGTKGWAKVAKRIRDKWKVLDIAGIPDFRHDLNSGTFFPLANNVVDNYYCSHTLEHINPENLFLVLDEMHRTLKPNGSVRIVVPDIKLAIKAYLDGRLRWFSEHDKPTKPNFLPKTILGYLHSWFYSTTKNNSRSGHNMVFDWETLTYYFQRVGFRNIVQSRYDEGSKIFKGLDFKRYRNYSLYLEAQK